METGEYFEARYVRLRNEEETHWGFHVSVDDQHVVYVLYVFADDHDDIDLVF